MNSRQFAIALVCVVVSAFAGGIVGEALLRGGPASAQLDEEVPEVLKAQSFVVVNAKGKTLATLGAERGRASLVLLSQDSKQRAWLGMTDEGPSLGLQMPDSKPTMLDQERGFIGAEPPTW